jgi:hypothetical protein
MHETPVRADEPLARYILDKSYFRSSDQSVKHSAFMPAKDGDLSVFRSKDLLPTEIAALGREFVTAPRGKPLLGFASLRAQVAIQSGLSIIGTREPHPRHANISNWPGGTENRLIAVKLAAAATLQLCGDGGQPQP